MNPAKKTKRGAPRAWPSAVQLVLCLQRARELGLVAFLDGEDEGRVGLIDPSTADVQWFRSIPEFRGYLAGFAAGTGKAERGEDRPCDTLH